MKVLRVAAFCLLPSVVVLPVRATDAGAPAPDADRFASAVLACHAHDAHRYARATSVTASELADGAAANCKAQMDAYATHAGDLAAKAGKGSSFANDYVQSRVRQLTRYAHDFTLYTVIRETANEVLLTP